MAELAPRSYRLHNQNGTCNCCKEAPLKMVFHKVEVDCIDAKDFIDYREAIKNGTLKPRRRLAYKQQYRRAITSGDV